MRNRRAEVIVDSRASRGEFWTTTNPEPIPFWWAKVMQTRRARHGGAWAVASWLRGRG